MENQKLSPEEIKKLRENIKNRASALKDEYKKQVSIAIITAFGLVIALVWKDVVTALLPSITAPGFLEKYPFFASLYTAMIITIVAVLGIILMTNWSKPKEKT
ncbi:MAG: DUF5654 family protein [Candidatus Pacearchaeota archaeon]|jgi:hypothetical protein